MADLTKVREIELLDADAFLALRTQLDRETENMMLEPGERDQDRVAHARFVHGMANSKTHTIFVAEAAADMLTGYIGLECGAFRRNRHAAVIVIGVLEAFQGVGSARGCSQLPRHGPGGRALSVWNSQQEPTIMPGRRSTKRWDLRSREQESGRFV